MNRGEYRYQFVAGHLALDFVNTVAFRGDPGKTEDRLVRADDVRRWARQAGLPERAAVASAPLGPAALRCIREVREQLFAVFHAIACDDPIPATSLARVGEALRECGARRRLSCEGGAVRWTWTSGVRGVDYVCYPVLAAAADLLTSDARGIVRTCEDPRCGWLFLDRSNARTRRWCRMADCGNRHKARTHYRRTAGAI